VDILLLSTPAQHNADNPAVETIPNKLQQWLHDLPTTNVIETVKELISAIEAFNELQLSDHDRLMLLEIYTQAFEDILNNYDNMRIRQLKISLSDQRNLAEDIMWLYLGLANGYKIVVKNGYQNQVNPKRDNSLLHSTYRSMEYIVRALIYAYHAHITPPPLTFLELNQLYHLAEHQKILNMPNKAIQSHQAAATIANLYKQICILTIADPYQFDTHQISELYMYLESFSSVCEIDPSESEAEDNDYFYTIDLMEDSYPQIYIPKEANTHKNNPYIRYMDIKPCLDAINSWLQIKPKKNDALLYEEEQQLLLAFNNRIDQQWSPLLSNPEDSTKVYIAIGLQAIFQALRCTEKLNVSEEIKAVAQQSVQSEFDRNGVLQWNIVESSKYGCSILLDHADGELKNLKINNTVTIIKLDGDNISSKVSIGLIRWIRHFEGGEVKCGIETLSLESYPIVWTTGQTNDPKQLKYYGVYLPKDESVSKPATLLLQKSMLNQKSNLTVKVRSKVFPVRLGAYMTETSSLVLTRFKVAM